VLQTRTIASAWFVESTGTAFAGVRGLQRLLVCPTFTLAAVPATTIATLIAGTTASLIVTITDEYDCGARKAPKLGTF
jgi:hypothetical protein